LRHHRIDWDDVDRLSRVRKGVLRSRRDAPMGGLVAVRGRRNILLVDRMEGRVEYDRLRSILRADGDRLGIERIATPPLGQTPTWMHRKAKWAPETTSHR
jgi:hypothetical protein